MMEIHVNKTQKVIQCPMEKQDSLRTLCWKLILKCFKAIPSTTI